MQHRSLSIGWLQLRACFDWKLGARVMITMIGFYFLKIENGHAQSSNLICEDVGGRNYSFPDSLVIDASSITLIPRAKFHLDSTNQSIAFKENYQGQICYRVFPIVKGYRLRHRSMSLYDSTVSFGNGRALVPEGLERDELFFTPELNKTGSLTRGISFGNSQSVNVLSGFNFQMDGRLTDKLNIRAEITDQNVPFQPEGNTQQVREFDNVTFEVYNDKLSLIAGDIVLRNGETYFLKHYKNALGGKFSTTIQVKDHITASSSLAIAAAKGQFADITVESEEGLQGPYRLTGSNGEEFVVVLANSEQVYLDGRLLKRGFNQDYIIDYNLGEITFNPNRLITQFSRIRVTFEYSSQNYSRSIISAQQSVQIGTSTKVRANYYREKDNRNKPLSFELTAQDQEIMSLAGEDNLQIPIPGEKNVPYSANLVLYEKRDTVSSEGSPESVFIYSRDSTVELYQVTFTYIGEGKGDYEPLESDVNGRVYVWKGSELGIKLGSYEPVRVVPAPNQKEMVEIGVSVKLGEYITWFGEGAMSNHDLNLYSEIGNQDNQDIAFRSGIKVKDRPLGSSAYKLSASVDYEYDGADFNPIDRYRSMEYDRDWSYSAEEDTFRNSDHIMNGFLRVAKDDHNSLSLYHSNRQKEGMIDGFQTRSELKKSFGSLKMIGNLFNLENQNVVESSSWRRISAETYYDQLALVPGYRFGLDRNEVRQIESDSLLRTAMNFKSHQMYLRTNDLLKTRFRMDYTVREDKTVKEGHLVPLSVSKTGSTQLDSDFAKGQSVTLNMTYRNLTYQSDFAELEDENLILGNLKYQGSFFKNQMRMDMSYMTSSSKELLREFIYVQVVKGEGTHAWRDLNEDGVQDITEFFEAINFDERDYIKILVPTSESIDANHTVFTMNMNYTMPRSWRNEAGLKKWLSKFSNNTSVNINKKTTENAFSARFNPFFLDINDENIVFSRNGIRSTLFYNRGKRGLGIDVAYSINNSKQLISRGLESRSTAGWIYNTRYQLNSDWTIMVLYSDQWLENIADYQEDRAYRIHENQISPSVIWQPTNNFRQSIAYKYTEKRNFQESTNEEFSKANFIQSETRWSNGAKNALTAKINYTSITFDGEENTAASYILLDAQQPGDNYNWQLNYGQKLFSGLQLNLVYEGRKSANQRTVHTGRMQVTALF